MTQALHLQDTTRDMVGDPQRVPLLGLSAAELEQAVVAAGMPKFRARQLLSLIHI